MNQQSINELATDLGLTIEAVVIPENGSAFKVFKGAKQIFIGTNEAVRQFLVEYEKDRPALFEGSMYGYQE